MNDDLTPMTADAIYATIAALSPAQQAMLTEISKHAEPVTVMQLSAALTLHPNSVRTTLDSLIALRLIDRQAIRRHGRGRPSWGYFPLAPDRASFAFTQMMELANIFCATLRETFDDPGAHAYDVGRAWGDRLISQIHRDCCVDPNADMDVRTSQMRVLYTSLGISAGTDDAGTHLTDLRALPFDTCDAHLDPLIRTIYSGLIERVMECACGCADACESWPCTNPACAGSRAGDREEAASA